MRFIKASPRATWLVVLLAAFVLTLALNLPGHLSVDSVISLAEGRTGERISWGPVLHAAILGFFDRISPGTGLYVIVTAAVLFCAWATLPALRPRLAWSGPALLLGAVALPQVVIWQGIVWKDVLFANLAVAGFVALALAGRWWPRIVLRLWLIALASLSFAVGGLVRQNGLIVVPFAAIVLGWIAARASGRRAGIGWALAGFVVPLVLTAGINAATPELKVVAPSDKAQGIRSVMQYDLTGALAADPSRSLLLERRYPEVAQVLRRGATKAYSPERTDLINSIPDYGLALWTPDNETIYAEWRHLVTSDPVGYALRRLDVFRWTFATPVVDRCLPVYLGVEGPPKQMERLDLDVRRSEMDRKLYNYATWFFDTPAMSHVAFAALALVVMILLLVRRESQDLAIAGLLGAALAFTASFAVISIACDYRYLYFLDLAAISGALYLAVDPRLRRARR